MASVRLEGLGKSYGTTSIVRDMTLEVRDGEFVVFVGPSGCGKTTTLRMIAGLESISFGTVSIGDRIVNDVPPSQRDIAMVFQNYALYPHMTARENITFSVEKRVRDRELRRRKVEELAERLEIGELLDRYPAEMSGGQKQRVALGRALIRDPAVLLMDEPLSNLDARLRMQMRGELKRLVRATGTTAILVTHDQMEAMTLGERVLVLCDGTIQQYDPPQVVYEKPANIRVGQIIGSPPMNFLKGALLAEGGTVRLCCGEMKIGLARGLAATLAELNLDALVLGVRPEGLRIVECGRAGCAAGEGIAAVVDLIERQGFETILSMRAGGQLLTARIDPGRRHPAEGDRISLEIDWEKAAFFHPIDGERIPEGTRCRNT